MSSKTQKANAAKTASAPKKLFIYTCIVALGFAVFFALSLKHASPVLKFGNQSFNYERAVTQQQQEKGLSYRQSLSKNQAMLFIFDKPDVECFWMKDMNFPLDMIWLNADKQVVHIEHDVQPSSYPNSFCPDTPAKYVIEVNAGTTTSVGLKTGDQVSF